MTTSTNAITGQVTVTDSLIRGDTYVGFTARVVDSENPSQIFSGTVVVTKLFNSIDEEIYSATLTADESVAGQVSVDFELPPSITDDFPIETITGEIQFTFTITVAGENLRRTAFALSFEVLADEIIP